MNKAQFLKALAGITVFSQNGQRAPHKPLLILLMLGRVQNGLVSPITWLEVKQLLGDLLQDFGRPTRAVSPQFPFWHLQSDGFWILHNKYGLVAAPISNFPGMTLLKEDAYRGNFSDDVIALLRSDPSTIIDSARLILDAHFPPTIHEDILSAVQISLDGIQETDADEENVVANVPGVRSGSFRTDVLTAYRYKCCICGFSLRMGNQLVGVEAAHIRWVKAGGPNTVSNGMAMCSVHHKLFDYGAFTILQDGWRLKVSDHLNGSGPYFEQLMQYRHKEIEVPESHQSQPLTSFLDWHSHEVYRG